MLIYKQFLLITIFIIIHVFFSYKHTRMLWNRCYTYYSQYTRKNKELNHVIEFRNLFPTLCCGDSAKVKNYTSRRSNTCLFIFLLENLMNMKMIIDFFCSISDKFRRHFFKMLVWKVYWINQFIDFYVGCQSMSWKL